MLLTEAFAEFSLGKKAANHIYLKLESLKSDMTWKTSLGDRVLTGAEASFYLTILQDAVEASREAAEFEEDLGIQTGDRIFDLATFDQRLVLWQQCLAALLKPDVSAPTLTNILEASAYFPFAFLTTRLQEEIVLAEADHDNEDWYVYRRLILATLQAVGMNSSAEPEVEAMSPPKLHSPDPQEWEDCIEDLADRIFCDRDWQLTHTCPQLLDGIEEPLANQTGILESYVQNRLPKVTPEEASSALEAILTWM